MKKHLKMAICVLAIIVVSGLGGYLCRYKYGVPHSIKNYVASLKRKVFAVAKEDFNPRTIEEARAWQQRWRSKLYTTLLGNRPSALAPKQITILRELIDSKNGLKFTEVEFNSTPDRTVHGWLAAPVHANYRSQSPGILTLNGHDGDSEGALFGQGIYSYGRKLAKLGFVVFAPDIGIGDHIQDGHLYPISKWILDALVSVNFLASLPEVDAERIGVIGLSLGAEVGMYVAAFDERIKITVSSGSPIRVSRMRQGHCPCWKYPALEKEQLDFPDIFSLIAPRMLVLESGRKDYSFPTYELLEAAKGIQEFYSIFGAKNNFVIDIHDYGHIFQGQQAIPLMIKALNPVEWTG